MRLGLYLDDATGLCHRSAGLYHRRDSTHILNGAKGLCHRSWVGPSGLRH